MEALYPGSSTAQRRFDVRVVEHVDRHALELDGLRVTPFEVRHASGAPAYALRVDSPDGSAAYSGDTEWTDALLDASDGVEVFLCEGYSPAPVRWHLDLETLARHRDRLTCRELVLTHLSPSALAIDLNGWTVAHDGLRLDLRDAPHERVGRPVADPMSGTGCTGRQAELIRAPAPDSAGPDSMLAVHGSGSCTAPAMNVVTTLWTASVSTGVPSWPVNSRCVSARRWTSAAATGAGRRAVAVS